MGHGPFSELGPLPESVGAIAEVAAADLVDLPENLLTLPEVRSYVDATQDEHEAHHTTLRKLGYRPLSLSMYGHTAAPRYAAVWVRRAGPDWNAIYGAGEGDWLSFYGDQLGQGFLPTIVTVTGTGAKSSVIGPPFDLGDLGLHVRRDPRPQPRPGHPGRIGTIAHSIREDVERVFEGALERVEEILESVGERLDPAQLVRTHTDLLFSAIFEREQGHAGPRPLRAFWLGSDNLAAAGPDAEQEGRARGYKDAGLMGSIFDVEVEGTVPLKQFRSPVLHYLTGTEDGDKDASMLGYQLVRRTGYVRKDQQANTSSLEVYASSDGKRHYTTATDDGRLEALAAGLVLQHTLGFVPTQAEPGTTELRTYRSPNGEDYWTTGDPTAYSEAEASGYALVRSEGFVYAAPPEQWTSLNEYRWVDHFALATPESEQEAEAMGYELVRILGYIFATARPDTVPLQSFLSPNPDRVDHYTSPFPNIAAAYSYSLIRTEGYIYPEVFQVSGLDWMMTPEAFDAACWYARTDNLVLRSAALFGDPVRVAAVWGPNRTKVRWNAEGAGENATQWRARLDAQVKQWARPALLACSNNRQYLSLFVDDQLGESPRRGRRLDRPDPIGLPHVEHAWWIARVDMTPDGYAANHKQWTAQGYYPFSLQGGGTGADMRFAAIYVRGETTVPRRWTVTGTEKDDPARKETFYDVIDDAMKAAMTNGNLSRSAGVAIARNGRLVLARGYTWAEPGYPVTRPTSEFRIASCSKPITSLAIYQLVERGDLTLEQTAYSLVNIAPYDGAPASESDLEHHAQVQVRHLLEKTSGYPHGGASYATIQATLGIPASSALSKRNMVQYQRGQSLPAPPSPPGYSNYAFLLLGMVVEAVRNGGFGTGGAPTPGPAGGVVGTGASVTDVGDVGDLDLTELPPGLAQLARSYPRIVKDTIWKSLGATRPHLLNLDQGEEAPGEVRYHDRELRVYPSLKHPGKMLPMSYGEFGPAVIHDATGGWAMAAPDYAKLLAAFDPGSENPVLQDPALVEQQWSHGWDGRNDSIVNKDGKKVTLVSKGGANPGTATVVWHRTDGISIVVFLNGSDPSPDFPGILAAMDAAGEWPDASIDLFPDVGLPSFPS